MEDSLKPHAYSLVYFGSVPDHVRYCIAQIKHVDPSRDIYFITDDETFDYPGIIIVRDYVPENLGNYFSDRKISLWTTSLQRVFALEWLAKKYSTKLIHFDCDVLIYYPFSKLSEAIRERNFITPVNRYESNFSYFVMSDLEAFCAVVSDIRSAVKRGEAYCRTFIKYMPNEMALMSHFSMGRLQTLPTNPLMSQIDGMIFDAADYGFYLDGMDPRYHNDKGKGFIHGGHYTGDFLGAIGRDNFLVSMEEGKPMLTWKNHKYAIFNLHVHTKNLKTYASASPPPDTIRDFLNSRIKTITKPNEKFPYRLGDAVLVEYPGARESVLHPRWRGTIGYTYFRHGGRNKNFALIKEIVKQKKQSGFEVAKDDEAVVHFRVGDWKRVEMPMLNQMKEMTQRMCSTNGLQKLRIVTAFHNDALTSKENPWGALPAYVEYCMNELKLNVDLKSSDTADEDFVFLTSAKYLICSRGNFSRLAYYTAETTHKELLSDEQ